MAPSAHRLPWGGHLAPRRDTLPGEVELLPGTCFGERLGRAGGTEAGLSGARMTRRVRGGHVGADGQHVTAGSLRSYLF